MEKYSQFRDRGSGIAPFFPVPSEPSGIYLPFHIFLFFFRLPLLVFLVVGYFGILQWLPIGSLARKAWLWCILGTPGIWWVDLQIDGVKRGALANNSRRLPQPGTVIASSSTSPLDALYLAAIFDPVFTASYPSTRLVQPLSLFSAILRAFSTPQETPPEGADLVDLQTLIREYPNQAIVVFPECTTTNGRGILPFSGSVLTTSPRTKIFPINLRYTGADVTTPVPGQYITFLWNLLSKPTHSLRVRIAESLYNSSSTPPGDKGYNTNYFESLDDEGHQSGRELDGEEYTSAEKKLLDKIGEALARLGRVKRVGLGVREKQEFVRSWQKRKSKS